MRETLKFWNRLILEISRYIFILDLTPGFNGLDKDKCNTRRETLKSWDFMLLITEVWRYINHDDDNEDKDDNAQRS